VKVSIKNREGGYASPLFLFALFLCSALALGAASPVASALLQARHEKNKTAVRREMEGLLQEVIDSMAADPTPELNSFDDPLWLWNGRQERGYRIAIKPASDRINPNFTRKNIFEKTRLGLLFRPGTNADKLQQFREDAGLSLTEDAFDGFFSEEVYEQYFSPYGWANINLIDEFAARSLGAALTGEDARGEALREKIRMLLMERRRQNRETLALFLGASREELWPFVNTEPLMNINFVEPLILEELLSYDEHGIKRPEERSAEILSRREIGGIGAADLRSILGIDPSHPLAHYFGSITWFWEILITAENRDAVPASLKAVVCRLPPESFPAETAPVYTIIERRFN
jgi:hypothetical protein